VGIRPAVENHKRNGTIDEKFDSGMDPFEKKKGVFHLETKGGRVGKR